MSRVVLGALCGLAFGAIDVGIMLPMSFPDKRAAITAAFIARFGIGFVIGAVRLPWPGWCVGLLFGLLLSIPDALLPSATHLSLAWALLAEPLSVSLSDASETS